MTRRLLAMLLVAGCGAPPPATAPATSTRSTPAPVVAEAAPPAPVAAEAAPPAPPPAAAPKAAPPKAVPARPAVATPSPVAAKPPALDLKALEQRLRATNAIGVLTKLSLKNQVDDLVTRFKTYHAGARPPTLAELRPAFDLLLMKVLSLLQDSDRALANDINASRDALWGVLTDREKLAAAYQ